jgi:hypothetical protein
MKLGRIKIRTLLILVAVVALVFEVVGLGQ